MVIPLVLLVLLFFRQSWIPRLIQIALFLGALEWLHTLFSVAQIRIQFGMPWVRMAVILGAVALFTALSGLVFRSVNLRKRYSADNTA